MDAFSKTNFVPACLAALALCGPASSAASAQSAKDLVGTWILIGTNSTMKDGSHVDPWGPNSKGIYMIDATGHFAVMHMRADLPKFSSKDRMKGTDEENRASVQGSFAYYGTYTVDEKAKILNLHIEGSTYSAANGTDAKRPYTITGDILRTANGATTDASTASTYSEWRRVK
jgi:hypothetical protein